MFPVIHLEFDGARFALGSYSLEPAAPARVAGLLDAEFQGVGEKPESIEQGALSHTVLTDDRRHGGKGRVSRLVPQAPQRHVLEHLEVLDSEAFYLGHPKVPFSGYVGAFYTTASRRRARASKSSGHFCRIRLIRRAASSAKGFRPPPSAFDRFRSSTSGLK